MKSKNSALLISLLSTVGLIAACSTLTPKQKTDLTNAITVTAKGLVVAAQVYQGLGEPGLPVKDRSTYNALTSAAAQLQPQVGSIINTAIIDTGTPAVNAALAKVANPIGLVSQSTVTTVAEAAALVKP